jgi:hypothetical protein
MLDHVECEVGVGHFIFIFLCGGALEGLGRGMLNAWLCRSAVNE